MFKIKLDGNFFFRSLSKFLFDTDNYYNELRKSVSKYYKENKEIINEFQNEVEIRKNVFIKTLDYIELIGEDKNWANDIELSIASFLFNINMAIYQNFDNDNFIEFLYIYEYELR